MVPSKKSCFRVLFANYDWCADTEWRRCSCDGGADEIFTPHPWLLSRKGRGETAGTLTSPQRVVCGDPALSQGEREEETLGIVEIQDDRFRANQNIMRRGKSLRAGETVLQSGAELGPAEIGLLAEVGPSKNSSDRPGGSRNYFHGQ